VGPLRDCSGRAGARTPLIERYGFLANEHGSSRYFLRFTRLGPSAEVVWRIGDDVISALRGLVCCFERPNTTVRNRITYNSEHLKVVWERLVLCLGSADTFARMDSRTKVSEAEFDLSRQRRSRLPRFRSGFFVDATGMRIVLLRRAPFELAGDTSLPDAHFNFQKSPTWIGARAKRCRNRIHSRWPRRRNPDNTICHGARE